MVEDLLAARGIIVSHQTVRLWAEKFGRHFALALAAYNIVRLPRLLAAQAEVCPDAAR
jgi:putative transposase